MRAIWAITVWALLGTGLVAAEKAKPDLSAGLEMLCEIAGIPDLSKAEPGTILQARRSPLARQVSWLHSELNSMDALSWKLGENPDGSLRVLLEGLHVVALYPLTDKDESHLRGNWQRQKLKTQLREATREMKRWRGGYEYRSAKKGKGPILSGGRYLLQAALLSAAGQPEAATRLATTLLDDKQAERVIAGAYCAAADRQYRVALLTFVETGDRPAFVKALQGLRSRFAKNWHGLAAMEHVLRTMQTSGAPPEAVVALGEEDRKLVADLMTGTTYHSLPEVRGWLFFAPQEPPYVGSETPLMRLLSKGMDAFPILFALADDPRPTTYTSTRSSAQQMEALVFGDDDDDDGDMEMVFGDEMGMGGRHPLLPHLVTGSELAQHILGQLWETGYGREREDAEESVEDAREWYQAHRGLSRTEAAKKLLGEREGRSLGILYLLSRPVEEKDYTEIGNMILKLDVERQFEPLFLLVRARKEKARPVVEQTIRKAKSSEDAKWVATELETLLPKKGEGSSEAAETFYESLDKALAKEDGQELYRLMPKAVPFMGSKAVAGELLKRAAETKTPGQRQTLLMLLQTVAIDRGRFTGRYAPQRITWEEFDKAPEVPAEPDEVEAEVQVVKARMLKLDLKQYEPVWRKLLPLDPSASVLSGPGNSATALWLFLAMYGPHDIRSSLGDGRMGRTALLQTLPGGMERQLRLRVQALLNTPGAPVAPWPDPDMVKPERVAEIVATLTKLPAAEARKQALTLPDDEYLALVQALPEHEQLGARLLVEQRWALPTCQFVGDVPPQVRDAFAGFAGKKLSKELGEAILAAGKKLVAEGHPFVAMFRAGPGLSVHFEATGLGPAAAPETDAAMLLERFGRQVAGGAEPGVHVTLGGVSRQRAFWPIQEGKKPTGAKADGLDQTLSKADADDLEDLIGGDGDAQPPTDLLLQALQKPPKDVLLQPRRSVSLLIVGLDENACKRVKENKKNRSGQ